MKSCIAIITARGGSKRIPRKNIRDFLGKPIIEYSINAALNAGCFTEVMVSTDDTEIAEVAIRAGAKVPFMRSAKNSDDNAVTAAVVLEVLDAYAQKGIEFDYCCCIYPTAPFVNSEKLINAFNLLKLKNAKSLIPVVKFSVPILRSFKIEDNLLKPNWPEYINYRSQDLAPAYYDAGQFYFLKVSSFYFEKKIFSDSSICIEMSESEVQDIDNEADWLIAEIKFQIASKKNEIL